MTRYLLHISVVLFFVLLFVSCHDSVSREVFAAEDTDAKAMLAGIWIDADEESVTFCAKGDTIYYPDTTSRPVMFRIVQDTMILSGKNETKYPIVRQTRNIFEFKNQNGDVVKLIRSENQGDTLLFVNKRPVVLNQKMTIKRDSVVSYGDKKYHCYIQVNPTRYKVYRSFTNAEGIEIDNIYYDNIIHVSIFSGTEKFFSKDFRKDDFKSFVPANMLGQMVLSDIDLLGLGKEGFRYQAQLAIPDSPGCFIVGFTVSYKKHIDMYVL